MYSRHAAPDKDHLLLRTLHNTDPQHCESAYESCYHSYATYRTRATVPPYLPDDDEYQYLIMVCADRSPKMKQGVVYGECVTTVDLRYALPSTFIRPHAQHGLVLKKVSSGGDDTFDLADRVVAILRMRTIDVLQWIGNGTLLTQSSLFPAPPFDFGYDILLSRQKELDLPIVWYVE